MEQDEEVVDKVKVNKTSGEWIKTNVNFRHTSDFDRLGICTLNPIPRHQPNQHRLHSNVAHTVLFTVSSHVSIACHKRIYDPHWWQVKV